MEVLGLRRSQASGVGALLLVRARTNDIESPVKKPV